MGLPRENNLCERSAFLKRNMTLAEKKLWSSFLREYPLYFVQQKVIGPYIVDFFCNKVRISIELDGSQHYQPKNKERDEKRTAYLKMLEIKELRFPNTFIWSNLEGVCELIHTEVQKRRTDLISLDLSLLKRKK